MPKKIKAKIKLQIPGGQATPAPPVGPSLGQHGLNIADFTQKFNQQTEDRKGLLLPVLITVYEDRTFDFVVKTPAASFLLKKAAKIDKGASEMGTQKVGSVTTAQIKEIAQQKMADLSANDLAAACKIIEGTARSMGIEVKR